MNLSKEDESKRKMKKPDGKVNHKRITDWCAGFFRLVKQKNILSLLLLHASTTTTTKETMNRNTKKKKKATKVSKLENKRQNSNCLIDKPKWTESGRAAWPLYPECWPRTSEQFAPMSYVIFGVINTHSIDSSDESLIESVSSPFKKVGIQADKQLHLSKHFAQARKLENLFSMAHWNWWTLNFSDLSNWFLVRYSRIMYLIGLHLHSDSHHPIIINFTNSLKWKRRRRRRRQSQMERKVSFKTFFFAAQIEFEQTGAYSQKKSVKQCFQSKCIQILGTKKVAPNANSSARIVCVCSCFHRGANSRFQGTRHSTRPNCRAVA